MEKTTTTKIMKTSELPMEVVSTRYGLGKVLEYRAGDSMYLVELLQQQTSAAGEASTSPALMLYTPHVDVVDDVVEDTNKAALPPLPAHNSDRIIMQQQQQGGESHGKRQGQEAAGPPKSATATSALLQDADGRPMFPNLYKWRLESREFLLGQQLPSSNKKQQVMMARQKQITSAITNSAQTTWNTVRTAVTTTTPSSSSQQQPHPPGTAVSTPYGRGRVSQFRSSDQMYTVELAFGGATLYTKNNVKPLPTTTVTKKKRFTATSLELNAAYEVSEQTRRQQLEQACAHEEIPFTETTVSQCFACLKKKHQEHQEREKQQQENKQTMAASNKNNNKNQRNALFSKADGRPMFPRLYKLRVDSQEIIEKTTEQQKQRQAKKKRETACEPCLLCGSTTCSEHASKDFRREGIVVCSTCMEHLEYNFEKAQTPEELDRQAKHLVELYRRAVLLLQYSSQFMLATADSLEQTKMQHNQVNVGSSSAGLVSGALGVAAACTILTPVGPPLLVASLVFGGSATAVQVGSEALKYYSEPNQLANRILALQGMVQSMVATTDQMCATTLLPYLDLAFSALDKFPEEEDVVVKSTAVRAGTRIGSTAATGLASLTAQEAGMAGLAVQETAVAGRLASRATTAAARTARFARFAGGALSAATLVLEARELKNTLDSIHEGSPCEKAKSLREIHAGLNHLPTATAVEGLCQSYVKVRSRQMFADAMDQFVPQPEEHTLQLVEEVVASLEARQGEHVMGPPTESTRACKPSLLERVKQYKERESNNQNAADPDWQLVV